MLAACLGFAMMMGTVAAFGAMAAELMHFRGPEVVMVHIVIMLIFLVFLRVFIRLFGGVGKSIAGETRNATDINEAQLMQDLHQGMSRMEQRVETLETLLLDRHHASAARPPGLRL